MKMSAVATPPMLCASGRGAVGVVQGQTYQNFFVHKDTLTSCVFFYKDTLPRPAPQEAKWPLS